MGIEMSEVKEVAGAKDLPLLRPTLFIGIGGTGIQVLGRFRRRIFERTNNSDFYPFFSFLGIDSDLAALSQEKRSPEFSPLKADDTLYIGMQNASEILENLESKYSHLNSFLPRELSGSSSQETDGSELTNLNFSNGARQIRPIGRMLFILQLEAIRKAIKKRVEQARSEESISRATNANAPMARMEALRDANGNPIIPNTDVVIVASLAGGTGAGGFLDCAYLLNDMLLNEELKIEAPRIFLVLPEAFEREFEGKPEELCCAFANGFAALNEIEHFNATKTFSRAPWNQPGMVGDDGVGAAPFRSCFLFSDNNGSANLRRAVEIYELIADCLAFSLGGSPLAQDVQSNWSNATNMTLAEIRRDVARTEEEGGPSPHEVGTEYLKFSVGARREYSAMGIAKITMRLKALRRLAAVSWIRALVKSEWEGVLLSKADLTNSAVNELNRYWNKSTEMEDTAVSDVFIGPKARTTLRDDFNAKLNNVDGDKAGDQAKELWGALLQRLNDQTLVLEVGDIGHIKARDVNEKIKQWANLRFSFTDRAAETNAGEIVKAYRNSVSLANAVKLLEETIDLCKRRRDEMRKKATDRRQKLVESEAVKTRIPRILNNFSDTDTPIGYDLLDLRHGAREQIRGLLRSAVLQHIENAANAMESTLDERFLTQLIEKLSGLGTGLGQEAERLRDCHEHLAKMQRGMNAGFVGSRNEVLTKEYAAEPGTPEDERVKDAVRRALGRKTTRTDVDVWGKNELLSRYGKINNANTPATMLDVFSKGNRNETSNNLVDIASQELLDNLPENNDVFAAMDKTPQAIDSYLTQVCRNAPAYWPVRDGARGAASTTRAFGAVENQGSDAYSRAVSSLSSSLWNPKLVNSESREAPFSIGDLTLVEVAHGYTLSSLSTLGEMKRNYQMMIRKGHVKRRHIDPSIVGQLPWLESISDNDASIIIRSMDVALKAIVTCTVKWDASRDKYVYTQRHSAPIYLENGFEQMARFFRDNPVGPSTMTRLEEEMNQALESDAAEARKDESRAAEFLAHLSRLAVLYDLIGLRIFLSQEAVQGRKPHPPNYTRVRRLAYEIRARCRSLIDHFDGRYDAHALESTARSELHDYVQFVGPVPARVAECGSEAAALRMLQIQRVSLKQGSSLLQTAAALPHLWFGKDLATRPPASLFNT